MRNYLADPDFRREYERELAELVADASAQAKRGIDPAFRVLRAIFEDEEQPAGVRITAARLLLEYSLKISEQVEIRRRLDDLETALEGGE